jgi:hypothetical protein
LDQLDRAEFSGDWLSESSDEGELAIGWIEGFIKWMVNNEEDRDQVRERKEQRSQIACFLGTTQCNDVQTRSEMKK